MILSKIKDHDKIWFLGSRVKVTMKDGTIYYSHIEGARGTWLKIAHSLMALHEDDIELVEEDDRYATK